MPVVAPGWASTRLRNTPSTRAVVLGIVSVCLVAVPYLTLPALGLAALALVFGVIGVRRSRLTDTGRARSVSGLALGGLGALGVAAVFALTSGAAAQTHEPVAALTAPAVADSRDSYPRLTARELRTLMEDPDAATGTRALLNGRIESVDPKTCSFVASVTSSNRDSGFVGTAWFDGGAGCASLRRGDHVKVWAVSVGQHAAHPAFTVTRLTTH
jgi:hypothetical protein